MKRDMDIIRAIMLKIEQCDDRNGIREVKIDGIELNVIDYHLVMLYENGLINGIRRESNAHNTVMLAQLTWPGHEFLDSARNDTIWMKAKEKATETGVTMAFSVLTEYLKHLAREKLGLPI